MSGFLQSTLKRLVATGLDMYVRDTVGAVRERVAARFAATVRGISIAARGAVFGVLVAALGAGGLVLAPVAGAVGIVALCYPLQTRTGLVVAAVFLLLSSLAYTGLSIGLLLYGTSEKAVRKGLDADAIERRIRGE